MAQQLCQLRYYGKDSDKNYPSDLIQILTNPDQKANKNILQNKGNSNYIKVYTIPGIKMVLNYGEAQNTTADILSSETILIGTPCIYELNLKDYFGIKTVWFENLDLIDNESNGSYLIVNFIYDDSNKKTL